MLKKMKLNYRLLLPNTVYLILILVVIGLYLHSSNLVQNLHKKQEVLSEFSRQTHKFLLDVNRWLRGDIAYNELKTTYETLASKNQVTDSNFQVAKYWEKVSRLKEVRQSNKAISQEVRQLTNQSIEQSNEYIRGTVKRLLDQEQRAKVNNLERQVIIGANTNTSTNYEVQIRFMELKENPEKESSLKNFLNNLVKNTKKDIQKLKGTAFEELPQNAQKANLKIKELVLEYCNNVEKESKIQQDLRSNVNNSINRIEAKQNSSISNFATSVNNSLMIILFVLVGISIIAFIISIFNSISISGALKRIIGGLYTSSNQVKEASDQLSSSSQKMAEGTSEQASSLEETSSSLEEMASQVKQNSNNANQTEQSSQEMNQLAEEAVNAVTRMRETIDEIQNASEKTSKIIKTIDDIAFQTNLLALNAAVEAARAGDAGKGFAVVAEEVRNLAQKSAEAANDTSQLIEQSQNSTAKGVSVMEEVSKNLQRLKDSSNSVNNLISDISAASKEQSQGIEQINNAVSEMDKVVQQNASDSEESASAAEELSSQARELENMIEELVNLVGNQSFQASEREHYFGQDARNQRSRQTTVHSETRDQQKARSQSNSSSDKYTARRQSDQQNRRDQNYRTQTKSSEQIIPLDEEDFKGF